MTRVAPATPADLATIQAAYADGRQLQQDRGAPVWPAFADASVLADIAEGRLFRVVDGGATVARRRVHRRLRRPGDLGRGALGRAGVRVDTWANNAALVAYYERLGFARVAERRLAADPRLPPHYHGLTLALLERPSPPATPHADARA